ncbi:hypothetical protein CR513_31808, partial [Mucuna pruriens]
MTLQLVDMFIKYPQGVMEHVLVKVEKLIFLVDFVTLNMEKDVKISLVLRRPFFNVLDEVVESFMRKLRSFTPLERVLMNSIENLDEEEEKKVEEFLLQLEALKIEKSLKIEVEELDLNGEKEKPKVELKQLPYHHSLIVLHKNQHSSNQVNQEQVKDEQISKPISRGQGKKTLRQN